MVHKHVKLHVFHWNQFLIFVDFSGESHTKTESQKICLLSSKLQKEVQQLSKIFEKFIFKNFFQRYSFIDYNKFVRHLSRHKGEKLFECTFIENGIKCGRRFSSSKNLHLHQMDHSSMNILSHFIFTIKTTIRTKNTNLCTHKFSDEPLPYACAYSGCNRRYKTAKDLEYHLNSHKGFESNKPKRIFFSLSFTLTFVDVFCLKWYV